MLIDKNNWYTFTKVFIDKQVLIGKTNE